VSFPAPQYGPTDRVDLGLSSMLDIFLHGTPHIFGHVEECGEHLVDRCRNSFRRSHGAKLANACLEF
jgi:hypothetical protein